LQRVFLLEQVTRARRAARVVARASTVGDLQYTLESVAQGTRETLDCDAVVLYVYDAAQARLHHPPTLAGVHYPERAMRLSEVPPDSLVYRMLRHNAPHIVEQVDAHPAFATSRFTREEAIKSCVVIPLKAGHTVGLMFANYRTPHRFTEEELTDLRLFADMAAVAIKNARYVEELQQTKSLVVARTALAWMGMASSAWRHSIDGHALTINETGKLLQGYCKDLALDPELRARIDTGVARIISVAAKILEKPITPPLSSEEAVATVDINDLLRERLAQLWMGDDHAAVALRHELAPRPLPVRVSPEWIRRAVDIVVANAVKAVRAAPTRRLTVVTRQVSSPLGDQVEIAFRDTGPGIPPALREQLFQRRIEKAEGEEGLGMGLLMAQAIVQADGGEIRVGATGPDGTTMLILLPTAHPALPVRSDP
jgi:K+-sensing histidine kinase KdpD